MSLVVRLSRVGKRGENHSRIVVQEKRSKRDGKAIEILGWYEKTVRGERIDFKKDRFEYWVSQGAIPSPTVKKITTSKT